MTKKVIKLFDVLKDRESVVYKLLKKELITPPKHIYNSIQYEVIVGSVAYGTSSNSSDIDIYGFSIPPKKIVFPHLDGYIPGFGGQPDKFEQFQQHHILNKADNKEYDITIFNIIKYFQLCMDNNPNMIDSLFTPSKCILHITQIGSLVRNNRKLFLHKGAYHRFKGYSHLQLRKLNIKNPKPYSKRYDRIKKYGYDTKFAYHAVRLLNECEQILKEGDLNLENIKGQLKSIKRGDWTKEQIVSYFNTKEAMLEELYNNSTLQHRPDENKIKTLLLNCLEQCYGNLNKIIPKPGQLDKFINSIKKLIFTYTGRK